MEKIPRIGVGVIIVRDNEVLLGKRKILMVLVVGVHLVVI
jgi:hypothetical protein